MTAEKPIHPQNIAREAKKAVKDAKRNPWIDRLTRLGYATRGIIYAGIAYFAGQLLLTGRGEITDQSGVLTRIAAQPFGKFMLIALAAGLLGMLFWGIVRAIADPYRKGRGLKGLVTRAGYFIGGLSYGALLFPTLNLITGPGGAEQGSSDQAEQAAAGLLGYAWGPWLVGLVGVVLIGVGLYRAYLGLRGKLAERLKSYEMSEDHRRLARNMGRVGYIAFGVVLATIGLLALMAAITLDAEKVGGLDQALAFLLQQPYGPWLLGLIALGLLAYAGYSFMGALWFRIKEL